MTIAYGNKNFLLKHHLLFLLLLLAVSTSAQHTFSIVAVDSITGEIGSAGATCGDSIVWPNTRGAILISDIIPGVGAIHTQASYNSINQIRARNRMLLGDSPQAIISWLNSNEANPSVRQYGIVDLNNGHPRASAFTGANCLDYKNHIVGPNYAIQGNILLGQEILDSMESRFNRTNGCLGEKLMAAMQGAKVIGADSRCTVEGTSSLSAFLRVAKPTDHPDTLFIDLNVAATPQGVDPIDELQLKYDTWNSNHLYTCTNGVGSEQPILWNNQVQLYPNPTHQTLHLEFRNQDHYTVVLHDLNGKVLLRKEVSAKTLDLDVKGISAGICLIKVTNHQDLLYDQKVYIR